MTAIKTSLTEIASDAYDLSAAAGNLHSAARDGNIAEVLRLAAQVQELAEKVDSEARHLEDINDGT